MFRNNSVLAYCALIYFSISFDISSTVLIIEALHVFSYYFKAHYLPPPFWCFSDFHMYVFQMDFWNSSNNFDAYYFYITTNQYSRKEMFYIALSNMIVICDNWALEIWLMQLRNLFFFSFLSISLLEKKLTIHTGDYRRKLT